MTQLPPSPDDAWGRFCGRADGDRELWVRPAHLAERHEGVEHLHANEPALVVARWAAEDFALVESLHRRISGSFGLMGAFGDASAPLDLDGAFALDPEEHHTRILAEVQGSFRSGRWVMHAAYRVPTADSFKVYLMYRPAKPGAIYVTLARLAWSWAGRAAKEADRWLLVSSDHARNPTGSPSSELPTWSDHFTAHLRDWR